MSKISPLPLSFYKGVGGKFGAVQFRFREPHFYCVECKFKVYDGILPPDVCPSCKVGKMKTREGCLFMEITSAIGPNEYDWDNKVSMSLSIVDLSKMLLVLEGAIDNVELLHDPGAKTSDQGKVQKNFSLSSPQGLKVGAMLFARQNDKEINKTVSHTVGINASEAKRLAVAIRAVIPRALAWD